METGADEASLCICTLLVTECFLPQRTTLIYVCNKQKTLVIVYSVNISHVLHDP